MKKLLDKINNSNKMKKVMPVFLVALLLILVTGVSYAIWNKTLTSNVNTITSGVVSMSFTESSSIITINNALPLDDSEGKVLTNYFDFSVTSNLTLEKYDLKTKVNYTIELESLTKKEKYYPTTLTSENLEIFVNYILDKNFGVSQGDEGYEEAYDEIKSTCENGTECIDLIQDTIDNNDGIAEYLLKIEVAEYVNDKFTIKKNLTDKQINSCAKYFTEKVDGYSVGDEGYEEKLSEYLITCNDTPYLEKLSAGMYGNEDITPLVDAGILIDNGSSYSYNTSATDEMVNACINFFMDGDSSDSYVFNMATLFCDGSPELQYYVFEENINTDFVDLVHNGLISYQESTLSKGYDALEDSQIKVYLEDITNDTSVAVEPILISALTNSDNGKLLFSGSHAHSYGVNTVNTNYRLRAWIDYDVDASSWTDEDKYEYKFRVNIKGDADVVTSKYVIAVDAIKNNNIIKKLSENYLTEEIEYIESDDSIQSSNSGLFEFIEGNNTDYFFRGYVNNNWVKFGKETVLKCNYNGIDVYLNENHNWRSGKDTTKEECEETNICVSNDYNDYNGKEIYMVGMDKSLCESSGGIYLNEKASYSEVEEDIYWRIYRITNSNEIRMMYAGNIASTEAYQFTDMQYEQYYSTLINSSANIGKSVFNSNSNSAEYVGYQYTLGETHGTEIDSVIKTYIDNWYNTNLLTNYDSYISNSKYCYDRTTYSGKVMGYTYMGNGVGLNNTWYMAAKRLVSETSETLGGTGASLICSNSNDIYTLKAGLISADELVIAGSIYLLYGEHEYWSGTPFSYSDNEANMFAVYEGGPTTHDSVDEIKYIRPVISIKSGVKIVNGTDGTWENPYEFTLE